MNKKFIIGWFLLVSLFSCSEEKKALKIKSVFDIPENVSENSLVNFGFKKQIPEKKEFVDFFGEKGNEIYEYNLKNYSTYIYKKENITSEIKFVQGTISSMRVSMDTIVWNELDKKLSQRIEIDTIYTKRKRRVFYSRPYYAEIARYKYKCKLPLKREDAWKQGCYINPVTKKKTYNYSEHQFHTTSLEREFTRKHQNKLKRIMKRVKTHFYYRD